MTLSDLTHSLPTTGTTYTAYSNDEKELLQSVAALLFKTKSVRKAIEIIDDIVDDDNPDAIPSITF